jgi:ribonuclease P protein subunit RPR2
VPLGKKKMRFCRSCGTYFVHGANARVRIKDKRTVITCLKCGDLRRY